MGRRTAAGLAEVRRPQLGPPEGRTHADLPSRRLCQWCRGWSRRGPGRRSKRGLGTGQRRFPRVLGPLLGGECGSCSGVPDSVHPHGPQPARPLCPWDSPGKTGSGLPRRSPGDVPDSGISPSPPHGLLRCRRIPPHLSRWGSAGGLGRVRSCQSRSCRPTPTPFPEAHPWFPPAHPL